jgi:hypothetical protein
MKTVEQVERKYTMVMRVRGPLAADEPTYLVKLRIGHKRYQVFPVPLDAKTANWFRRQLAISIYKLIAYEGDKT